MNWTGSSSLLGGAVYVILLSALAAGLLAELRGPAVLPGRSTLRTLIARWAALTIVATVIFATAHALAESPSPLGCGLPAVPQIFTIQGVDARDASLVQRRIPAAWLEFLAPQPDGTPPLRYPIRGDLVDYSIKLPMGASTTTYPADSFMKDWVLADCVIQIDQPLKSIQFSVPQRREGETSSVYAARRRAELEQRKAHFYHDFARFESPGLRFEHFEYALDDDGKLVTHFLYIAPFAKHVFQIDFRSTPELHEQARAQVLKIMRSFVPGEPLKQFMIVEDPKYISPPAVDGRVAGEDGLPGLDIPAPAPPESPAATLQAPQADIISR